MASLPPNFNPESLALRQATEQEKVQTWRNNSEAWSGSLSLEQYIGLQNSNGHRELTNNGGLLYWIFTDGKEIYCAAETLRKPIIISDTCEDGVKEGHSYGVAAVFTPPRFRRRGIASSMMRRLAAWFDTEEADCRFTTLFSAVGDFYESFGWDIVPTRDLRIPISCVRRVKVADCTVNLLTRQHLPSICASDVKRLTREIGEGGDHARLAFLPTYATADWQFGAEEYIAAVLPNLPEPVPVIKGASIGSGNFWCYWVHDFMAGRLTILRLYVPQSDKKENPQWLALTGLLLQAASDEAAHWGLGQVAIWDPDSCVFDACTDVLGVEPIVRDEIENYVPCLRWNSAEQSEKQPDAWVLREAYQRC